MSGKRPRRTKRQLNAELKKRRLEVLSDEPGPSTIPAPAPYVAGPSTVPAPAPYAETHEEERERTSSTDDEEETMRESESENERELSSSESEGDFDTDDAQHCFDDCDQFAQSSSKDAFRFSDALLSATPRDECEAECARGGLHYWL